MSSSPLPASPSGNDWSPTTHNLASPSLIIPVSPDDLQRKGPSSNLRPRLASCLDTSPFKRKPAASFESRDERARESFESLYIESLGATKVATKKVSDIKLGAEGRKRGRVQTRAELPDASALITPDGSSRNAVEVLEPDSSLYLSDGDERNDFEIAFKSRDSVAGSTNMEPFDLDDPDFDVTLLHIKTSEIEQFIKIEQDEAIPINQNPASNGNEIDSLVKDEGGRGLALRDGTSEDCSHQDREPDNVEGFCEHFRDFQNSQVYHMMQRFLPLPESFTPIITLLLQMESSGNDLALRIACGIVTTSLSGLDLKKDDCIAPGAIFEDLVTKLDDSIDLGSLFALSAISGLNDDPQVKRVFFLVNEPEMGTFNSNSSRYVPTLLQLAVAYGVHHANVARETGVEEFAKYAAFDLQSSTPAQMEALWAVAARPMAKKAPTESHC